MQTTGKKVTNPYRLDWWKPSGGEVGAVILATKDTFARLSKEGIVNVRGGLRFVTLKGNEFDYEIFENIAGFNDIMSRVPK